MDGSPEFELTPDEKAAIRAFLQRSEVRLSTVHRVASALLSGAGVMVLLPPVAKDSIVTVITTLSRGTVDLPRLLLLVATVLSLLLPLVAFWFLVRDMTRFYFHAQHLSAERDRLFLPRFTLTGLQLPAGELAPGTQATLDTARRAPHTVEVLVPSNADRRTKVDARLAGYGIRTDGSDGELADGLFVLAASQSRSLLEEVAKLEHGMARHILNIQAVVLRYVKALLAFMATALAVFTMSAIEARNPVTGPIDEVWLASVLTVWAAATAIATAAPVRWVEQIARHEGAARTGVANDTELTRVERVSTAFAVAVWLLAVGAIVGVAADQPLPTDHGLAVTAVCVASGLVLAWHGLRLRADRRGVPVWRLSSGS